MLIKFETNGQLDSIIDSVKRVHGIGTSAKTVRNIIMHYPHVCSQLENAEQKVTELEVNLKLLLSLLKQDKIIKDQISYFVDEYLESEESPYSISENDLPSHYQQDDIDLHNLELSVKTVNCLHDIGITKLSELLNYSELDLLKTRLIGKKSIEEIKACLVCRNLFLDS